MTRREGTVLVGRWAASKGWIHALLLVGVVVCVYPLLWMFMMSVRTDEEISRDEIVPTIPVFRDHSPYVRDPLEVARPTEAYAARFAAALPALRTLTTSIARSALPQPAPPSVDPQVWASSAASVLLNRTLNRMPKQVWEQEAVAVSDEYRALLTPETVSAA